ncbi:hypothetical protein PIB30_052872 [Stylosanthes scabra]|uniref:Uncharacterized protein n=1 Tax=Stylosanthes scabra TaxID=79078 RepID=A0ABU6WIS7_9FABA|nr:hypothetical protein [Stylosanthes scabra]
MDFTTVAREKLYSNLFSSNVGLRPCGIRFDPDRPYELPIKSLLANQPLNSLENGKSSTRGSHPSGRSSPTPHYSPKRSSSQCAPSSSPTKDDSSLLRQMAGNMVRRPKSWQLIPPSEGWMCERKLAKEKTP